MHAIGDGERQLQTIEMFTPFSHIKCMEEYEYVNKLEKQNTHKGTIIDEHKSQCPYSITAPLHSALTST